MLINSSSLGRLQGAGHPYISPIGVQRLRCFNVAMVKFSCRVHATNMNAVPPSFCVSMFNVFPQDESPS